MFAFEASTTKLMKAIHNYPTEIVYERELYKYIQWARVGDPSAEILRKLHNVLRF